MISRHTRRRAARQWRIWRIDLVVVAIGAVVLLALSVHG
jgi:hypothetical protein